MNATIHAGHDRTAKWGNSNQSINKHLNYNKQMAGLSGGGGETMSGLSARDAGIILALLKRFEAQRLPTLLALKEKVDNNGVLSDADIEFLSRVIDDASRTLPMTEGHPELHNFCTRVVHLYDQITARALENEEQ